MSHSLFLLLLFAPGLLADVRFDCHPEPDASQQNCESRGCSWSPTVNNDPLASPWCIMKPGVGYKVAKQTISAISLVKNSGPKNPWGQDFSQLTFSTNTLGSTLNVKITTSTGSRYTPPVDFPRNPSTSTDSLTVRANITADPFYFEVVRKSSNRKLFDTSLGGLIFSDKFIQIATKLPSENMYGWGENVHQNIKHDFTKYLTWGMLARDEPPNSQGVDTKNLYGVHPFYMVVEPDGKAHGVLIVNSNPQEVTTTPGPALIYRTTGGWLDMYFFPGPNPEDVIKQYQQFIGKPFLPAYWALGYQLSRYGYKNLTDMQDTIGRVRNAGIPIDTAVADIDYMDRYKDFTVGQPWTDLPSYTQTLKQWGMRLILIWDPAIQVDYPTFQRGLNQNARFIEWERYDQVMHSIQDMYPMAKNTKIMLGVVWPDRHVAFPDFFDTSNATTKWWINEFKQFYSQVQYDGIWIDMNEPANFGTNQQTPWYFDNPDHPDDAALFCPMVDGGKDAEWDMPPYKTHNVWNYKDTTYLASKTLCMLGVQMNGSERFFNLKNLYGWSEARATQQALWQSTGKRGAVISRSTFPSAGRYAGHWLGDNSAHWEDLRTSVIGAQEFNIFGIPYVGSDVCGFNEATNEELCLRWQQMGAFHSFFRNHNSIGQPPQDPSQWPSVSAAAKKANLFRYRYLPYLYTLHHLVTSDGGTVVRPVFFEFPHDIDTYNLSYQFMWGSNMMIAPVVTQGATTVSVYIPDGSFYSVYDYGYGQQMEAGYGTYTAPTSSLIPVFVRSGSIIPRQVPDVTTTASRKNPFEVLIVPDENLNATGILRWDDGESLVPIDLSTAKYWDIQYLFSSDVSTSNFTVNIKKSDTSISLPTLDTIEIFNHPSQPDFTSFQLNGKKVNINIQTSSYSPFTKILTVSTKNLIPFTGSTQTLTWKNYAAVDRLTDNRTFYRLN